MAKLKITTNDRVRAFALFYFSNFSNSINDVTPKIISDNIIAISDFLKEDLTDDERTLLIQLKCNLIHALDLFKSLDDGIANDDDLLEFYQDKIQHSIFETLNIANILSR